MAHRRRMLFKKVRKRKKVEESVVMDAVCAYVSEKWNIMKAEATE